MRGRKQMVKQRWYSARYVQKGNLLDGLVTQHLLFSGGGSRTTQRVQLGSSTEPHHTKTCIAFACWPSSKAVSPPCSQLCTHPSRLTARCRAHQLLLPCTLLANPAFPWGAGGQDCPGRSRICPKAQWEYSAQVHMGTHEMKHSKCSSELVLRFFELDKQKKQTSSWVTTA